MCRRNGITGEVNIHKVQPGGSKYRKACSYILQEDNLYPTFNVQETMMMAASLKIAGVSQEEKEIIVIIFES